VRWVPLCVLAYGEPRFLATSAHESTLEFLDALYRENNFSIAATEPGLLDRMFHKHRLQSTSFGFGLVALIQGRFLTFI
jgi:hypothetical protein